MIELSYKDAEEVSLKWNKEMGLMLIAFVDAQCTECKFFNEEILPFIDSNNITTYTVDLRTNEVPFPPASTPTLYWYFAEGMPPLVKKGSPPSKEVLIHFIDKMYTVYNGEKTVEEEFF
jgi:hypothetical protein